jgi:hypothetical protein
MKTVFLAIALVFSVSVTAGFTASGIDPSTPDPVIAAAGDIACSASDPDFNEGQGSPDFCAQGRTSDLLVQGDYDAILALGDLQYGSSSLPEFLESYDPSWGRVKSITHPVPGNHENGTEGSAGYFDYFNGVDNLTGPAGERGKGYYSFDLGEWHLIALNSNCGGAGVDGGCGSDSPQVEWLRADLEENSDARCTLAFWHIPRYSSSRPGKEPLRSFWRALYEYDADLILNGHSHAYERFQPSDPDGLVDGERGIHQFVVGTGGRNHKELESNLLPNSVVYNNTTFGVLRLALHPTSYDWQFVPEANAPVEDGGAVFSDSGSADCH